MFIWVTIVFLSTLPSAETAPVKAIEGPAACYLPAGESDLADLVAVAYEGLTGRVPQNVIVKSKDFQGYGVRVGEASSPHYDVYMNDLTAFLYREACMKGSKATEKIEKAKQAKLSFASEKCGKIDVEIPLGVVSTVALVWAIASTVALVIVSKRLVAARSSARESQDPANPAPLGPQPMSGAGANNAPAGPGSDQTGPGPIASGNNNRSNGTRPRPATLAARAAILRSEEATNPFLEASSAWND